MLSYQILPRVEILLVLGHDELDIGDLADLLSQSAKDARIGSVSAALIELREVAYKFALRDLGDLIRAYKNTTSSLEKIAILAERDVDYGIARYGQQIRELSIGGEQVEVFRKRAKALQWLGLDPDWITPDLP